MEKRIIPFSPPDLGQKEIDAVVEVLNSGWITTGPKVGQFEEKIKAYCQTDNAVAVGSNSQGLDLILKVFNFNSNHDVLTTPYTYAATINAILHRGSRPVLVDLKKDTFFMDYERLSEMITPRTKAIMTVDIGGYPADYDGLKEILKLKGREDILLLSDSAHSFGAWYKGRRVGGQLDFHIFSFHAVKNLTTAEGGAITFNQPRIDFNKYFGNNAGQGINKDLNNDLPRIFKYTSLNGQSKDALTKMQAGAWRYDILTDGMKCNMTDISASIGLAQLEDYNQKLERRQALHNLYNEILGAKEWAILPPGKSNDCQSSYHLYLLRINGLSEENRDKIIQELASMGISTNVHYIPIPMFTYYKEIGYSIKDYPNTYNQYANEISLPLYSKLSLDDCAYVAENVVKVVEKYLKNS
ncbi:MAG: DegT/DnrJ/EryC1/StrS aminotransferase family protein [Peptococcaceae bacterium]|nr:DegT/DnrJ/EryC1/StrS aminotransferase family protein [Peptococcaceae bacterium]